VGNAPKNQIKENNKKSELDTLLAKGKEKEEVGSLWFALWIAFLGGLLLNLMPCVFPVLSIKLLHFVEQAKEDAATVKKHGWAFTAGIVISFMLLAGLLLLLRTASVQSLLGLEGRLGWGYQLQSTASLLPLILLLFGMGLSLSGLFEITGSWTGAGGALADRGGYTGSFFTGFLATLVATPCTAPFMGAAVAYALLQPPLSSLAIFGVLGLGMAFPYLMLSLNPSSLRLLPRPGRWMEIFKQAMAFPLYATAIWLLWVLASLAGTEGILVALLCVLGVAFAAWLTHITPSGGRAAQISRWLALAMVLGLLAWGIPAQYRAQQRFIAARKEARALALDEGRALAFRELRQRQQHALPSSAPSHRPNEQDGASPASSHRTNEQERRSRRKAPQGTERLPSLPFQQARLNELLRKKERVFLNFTADWCITCKVNERVALRSKEVIAAFRDYKIRYLLGDWTDGGKEIGEVLTRFKREGVPLYVLFDGESGKYEILPQMLTPSIVIHAIKKLYSSSSSPSSPSKR
jgi:thiol:disulfide interchange protein DsbD